ncbi:hypothetical protein LINPERHAP1_LOCUS3988, partial [Linum perenne]
IIYGHHNTKPYPTKVSYALSSSRPPHKREKCLSMADREALKFPDTGGKIVIPLCNCGLPATVQAVHPPAAQKHTPYQHFLGCSKKTRRCRMTMWCKLKDRKRPEEEGGVQVYGELVIRNMELESNIGALEDHIETIKWKTAELKASYFDVDDVA